MSQILKWAKEIEYMDNENHKENQARQLKCKS